MRPGDGGHHDPAFRPGQGPRERAGTSPARTSDDFPDPEGPTTTTSRLWPPTPPDGGSPGPPGRRSRGRRRLSKGRQTLVGVASEHRGSAPPPSPPLRALSRPIEGTHRRCRPVGGVLRQRPSNTSAAGGRAGSGRGLRRPSRQQAGHHPGPGCRCRSGIVHRRPGAILGGPVADRLDLDSGLGLHRPHRDPEVGQVGVAVPVQEDVGRLDIARWSTPWRWA